MTSDRYVGALAGLGYGATLTGRHQYAMMVGETAAGLCAQLGFSAHHTMVGYVRTCQSQGCIDMATYTAIEAYRASQARAYCGGRSTRHMTDGCLVLSIPVALWYARYRKGERHTAVRNNCRLTNKNRISVDAVLTLAEVVTSMVMGVSHRVALQPRKSSYFDCMAGIYNMEYTRLPAARLDTSGSTVGTLIASLWCLWRSSSFGEAMGNARELGDMSCIRTVVGALAGARYGMPPGIDFPSMADWALIQGLGEYGKSIEIATRSKVLRKTR